MITQTLSPDPRRRASRARNLDIAQVYSSLQGVESHIILKNTVEDKKARVHIFLVDDIDDVEIVACYQLILHRLYFPDNIIIMDEPSLAIPFV